MAEKLYNVVFTGKLTDGKNPKDILENLSAVLRMPTEQVRELFKSGAGSVVMRNLSQTRAYNARDDLRTAGALCSVQEAEGLDESIALAFSTEDHAAEKDAFEHGSAHPAHSPDIIDFSLPDLQLVRDTPAPEPSRLESPPPYAPSLPVPPAYPEQAPSASPPPSRRFTSPPQLALEEESGGGSGMLSLLVKLILLAGLVGGGWWGYDRFLAPPSPAFRAYAAYADALAREEYFRAEENAMGEAREYAASLSRALAPKTVQVYGKSLPAGPRSIKDIAGEVHSISFKKKSERKSSDKTLVSLQVEETVCRIPPGVTSALCKWPVTFRHDVEVRLDEGQWKVEIFKEERLTPQE